MKEKISQIRDLLNDLEKEATQADETTAIRAFSGLELPDIVCDIVDLLMPGLKPYEAAIYLHLFRHSVVENGSQLVRASRRGLSLGVIKSSYSGTRSGGGKDINSAALTFQTVQGALEGLVAIGALRPEGEANRDGTLYRLMLPEEIEVCRRAKAEQAQRTPPTSATESEADYYNVRENRLKIYERDSYKC
jgi:CheY-like chemotaxis protein